MTKEYTPEEIKYRLSDLGVQIGNIAINYITELEKACDETQELLDKQIEATYKLDKENAELKKKLKEKLKTIADKDLSFVAKFDALEKENAELKADNDARKFAMAMSEKVEKQLREENAELKDDNKVMADNYSKMEQKFYDNLTKAKEIIKELLNSCFGYNSKTVNYEVKVKAEQFLSEVEK